MTSNKTDSFNNQYIKFKRVIIISAFDLTTNSATDITLRSYFKYWPKDKLMILTTSSNQQFFARTLTIKSSFKSQIRAFLVSLLLKRKNGVVNKNIIPGMFSNDFRQSLGLKQKAFMIIAAYFDLINPKISRYIHKEINDFKPEIIYTIMGNIRILRAANSIAKKYKIPIVPHFMDDWISTTYTGSIFFKIPRNILLSSLKKMLSNAKFGYCISEKMCLEYYQQFHLKFFPLMNIVDSKNLTQTKIESNNFTKETEIVFTYFGGLHLNRWKSLKIFSDVLATISKEKGYKLILEIYTTDDEINKYSLILNQKNIVFKKYVSHDIALQKMAQTNFLIHVESFEKAVIAFTRLSLSTKIPEYLAASSPIIAIGPPNIASMKYLIDNECAYVITSLEFPTIKNIIDNAIQGINMEILKANAYKLYLSNHSIKEVEKFLSLLSC